MADHAKVTKLLPVADDPPDFGKPTDLSYWALPVGEYFGNKTLRLVATAGFYEDGTISGRVKWIRIYPNAAVVIAVEQGWQPGKPEHEQKMSTRYVVCVGSCHGVTA